MRPLLLLPLAAAACADFATPAQLERPTIIAVVADPPIITPGAQSRLSVVIADRSGVLTGLPTRWEVGEAFPGVPPMGTITPDGDGAIYTAPDPLPTRPDDVPPVDAVAVTVETADGTRAALKAVPVLTTATANPAITALAVGDRDALPGTVTVSKGETLSLSVTTDPPASADATYAWYTPVGDIKFYQSNPCDLVLDDESASGPLLVVVRDGVGGVVWRQATLQVQ